MHDAVEVVKALLQDYSDETLLYLMMTGAEHVKEAADAFQHDFEGLTPLESAESYVSRRMDRIIKHLKGELP